MPLANARLTLGNLNQVSCCSSVRCHRYWQAALGRTAARRSRGSHSRCATLPGRSTTSPSPAQSGNLSAARSVWPLIALMYPPQITGMVVDNKAEA